MYNKLFTKILDSSIWLEPMPTRIVWMTFIAAMDENGYCQFASAGNVAARARVSIKEAEKALECLEAPDPNSSNPEHEGRRLERVPGGWMVLNAKTYREMVTRAIIKEQTRERVRRFREVKRNGNAPVTPSDTYTEARSETKAEIKTSRASRSAVVGTRTLEFDEFWNAYPRRTGKANAIKAWTKHQPPLSKVLASLSWQVNQPRWVKDDGQFIPHPATWLNAHGWEDEPFHAPMDLSPQRGDTLGIHTAKAAMRAMDRERPEPERPALPRRSSDD